MVARPYVVSSLRLLWPICHFHVEEPCSLIGSDPPAFDEKSQLMKKVRLLFLDVQQKGKFLSKWQFAMIFATMVHFFPLCCCSATQHLFSPSSFCGCIFLLPAKKSLITFCSVHFLMNLLVVISRVVLRREL